MDTGTFIVLMWDHWHIECSSICALRCPRCPRTEAPESALNRQLTLDFFQNQIGADVIINIRKITFCGNDGDPIYCRDLIDICAWLKSVNPSLHLVIVTNGSGKSTTWWQHLAHTLDDLDEIHWSIDGWDQHSNQQYRDNCDWSSIEQGIKTFTAKNSSTYRVWATIAFKFNQDHLGNICDLARQSDMDLWQLTKSTKFASHYPDQYGEHDALRPDRQELVSSSHRFEREQTCLTKRKRPGHQLIAIYQQRADSLIQQDTHSGICLIGNKGVFVNSQGNFFPCCWTANRYQHNRQWHDLAQQKFNLWNRSFHEILSDPFWQKEFLAFDSLECKTKCTKERLKDTAHVTEW